MQSVWVVFLFLLGQGEKITIESTCDFWFWFLYLSRLHVFHLNREDLLENAHPDANALPDIITTYYAFSCIDRASPAPHVLSCLVPGGSQALGRSLSERLGSWR